MRVRRGQRVQYHLLHMFPDRYCNGMWDAGRLRTEPQLASGVLRGGQVAFQDRFLSDRCKR